MNCFLVQWIFDFSDKLNLNITKFNFAKISEYNLMAKKHKAQHVLNWFYGNICTKKCYGDDEKQKKHYEAMQDIIKGHEDYMITHKMFIWAMRNKHKICDISEAEFRKSESDFWTRKL